MTPEQFKAWRKAMNLSQTKAAEALGVTRSTVDKWESGINPIGLHIALACAAVYHRLDPWKLSD